jgi:hypothetical protein
MTNGGKYEWNEKGIRDKRGGEDMKAQKEGLKVRKREG